MDTPNAPGAARDAEATAHAYRLQVYDLRDALAASEAKVAALEAENARLREALATIAATRVPFDSASLTNDPLGYNEAQRLVGEAQVALGQYRPLADAMRGRLTPEAPDA